jgi:hypothetical protein
VPSLQSRYPRAELIRSPGTNARYSKRHWLLEIERLRFPVNGLALVRLRSDCQRTSLILRPFAGYWKLTWECRPRVIKEQPGTENDHKKYQSFESTKGTADIGHVV